MPGVHLAFACLDPRIDFMLTATLQDDHFRIADSELGVTLDFGCGAACLPETGGLPLNWSPWRVAANGAAMLRAECRCGALVQRVEIETRAADRCFFVRHSLTNDGSTAAKVNELRTVDGTLRLRSTPEAPAYLHSLNTRHELPPLARLTAGKPSIQLGRVTYMFFEGLAVVPGEGQPCIVTGPTSQHIVHRTQRLTWDGGRAIRLETMQDLRGLVAKEIAPGETLKLDGVFVQFLAHFDANTAYAGYLAALREAIPTRWPANSLRREHFFAPWNNFLYWEAEEHEVLDVAQRLARDFPSVRWMGIDDGYQQSPANPRLPRDERGERIWSWDTEYIWWKNCPGVSFGFTEGLGEDRQKFPGGLLELARKFRALGLHPMLWLGMEISADHPLCARHPDWFHSVRAYKDHAVLDISVPAVRAEVERVFRTYFGPEAWHAVKLDFWSHLFERPDLRYREGNLTAAEWRRWFYDMIRSCLPPDGFISLGCDIGVGSSWLAPWVDSYRFSNDMRDGDWNNVRSNVRWSAVPVLTHGFGEPIGDSDSASIFNRLSRTELLCWADYAHQTGSFLELSGNVARWTEEERALLRTYLDEPTGGGRCWIGDAECWERDGLPRVLYRQAADGGFVLSLHNWGDDEIALRSQDWVGPVTACSSYIDLRSGEVGRLGAETLFRLEPRSSRRLRVQ